MKKIILTTLFFAATTCFGQKKDTAFTSGFYNQSGSAQGAIIRRDTIPSSYFITQNMAIEMAWTPNPTISISLGKSTLSIPKTEMEKLLKAISKFLDDNCVKYTIK